MASVKFSNVPHLRESTQRYNVYRGSLQPQRVVHQFQPQPQPFGSELVLEPLDLPNPLRTDTPASKDIDATTPCFMCSTSVSSSSTEPGNDDASSQVGSATTLTASGDGHGHVVDPNSPSLEHDGDKDPFGLWRSFEGPCPLAEDSDLDVEAISSDATSDFSIDEPAPKTFLQRCNCISLKDMPADMEASTQDSLDTEVATSMHERDIGAGIKAWLYSDSAVPAVQEADEEDEKKQIEAATEMQQEANAISRGWDSESKRQAVRSRFGSTHSGHCGRREACEDLCACCSRFCAQDTIEDEDI